MNRPKIKICGITQKKQGIEIAEMGIDALGFILYQKSPRYIAPETIRDIIKDLPPLTKTVGVFVNESIDDLGRIARSASLDMVQLSGDESPDYCSQISALGLPWIKAFRIKDQSSIKQIQYYATDTILLDAWSSDEYGGTGKVFDWSLLRNSSALPRIILAGGLTAENATEAVRQVAPYGLDLSSGVEISPGVKSIEKVRLLLDAFNRA